ncbi:hypothetical protein SBRCBS47491_001145 [Sporothrix bragantina]|uniref:Major facilitator superfamily transporter n=1 Tax=Sporothrix bragantina TaxID=671064 RepID=A0ABP0AW45_9PEZI
MHDQAAHRARIVSSVAATVISLACGTNYVYSAWAPQFADKLKLSATQSNLIGLAGNLGMYSMGVPIGMFIDTRGPRPAVIAGSLLLALGYFPLRQAFEKGSGSVAFLCLASYLTGLGGCMAFAAAVKTSALNWPHHRGTATAFPLAAFGLSAFFFSLFGSLIVPGDTSAFLLLLAIGTFVLTFVSFFFLHVLPHTSQHQHYHAVSDGDGAGLSDSQQLRRTVSEEAKLAKRGGRGRYYQPPTEEPGRFPDGYDNNDERATYEDDEDPVDHEGAGAGAEGSGDGRGAARATRAGPSAREEMEENWAAPQKPPAVAAAATSPSFASHYASIGSSSASASAPGTASPSAFAAPNVAKDADQDLMDETSSLMSKSSSLPGEILVQNSVDMDQSHRVDIRGWKLLRNVEFWQFFAIMGILAGIGLMTINNIGHDANALWKNYDPSVDESFLVGRQQMHVSILSIGSFAGRLSSGVGSDFLVKRLHASRVWCLVIAAIIFVGAQVCAINIVNPHYLGLVSSLSGLGYGFLFGVFPSIVAETFGIHGLSQNWGFMTLSPVVSGNVFNIFYGTVFDHHSIVEPSGERSCDEGLACYRAAYFVTLAACGLGLAVTLFVIRHQRLQREKEAGKRSLED